MSDAPSGHEVDVVTVADLLDRHGATVDLEVRHRGRARLFADCRAWIGRVRQIVIELDGLDETWLLARLADNGAFAVRHAERRHDVTLAWLAAVDEQRG